MKVFFLILLLSNTALAHPGVGIVKDTMGNVFFTDLKQVWKIDPAGNKSIAVQNVHTHELYLDPEDNLFGAHLWYNGEEADTWGSYIWKLTAAGALQKILPDTAGFREGFSFVRDHLGRAYQADRTTSCQHIRRTNLDQSTSTLGNKCLSNIRWMTASPTGHVYLVDDGDIKKVDPFGKVTVLAGDVAEPKATQFFANKDHYLSGISLDKDQNVYVCDYSARDVKKIGRDGEVTVVVRTSLPWSPAGVLIDDERGDLWILEYSITNEVRVERVDKEGNRLVF